MEGERVNVFRSVYLQSLKEDGFLGSHRREEVEVRGNVWTIHLLTAVATWPAP